VEKLGFSYTSKMTNLKWCSQSGFWGERRPDFRRKSPLTRVANDLSLPQSSLSELPPKSHVLSGKNGALPRRARRLD